MSINVKKVIFFKKRMSIYCLNNVYFVFELFYGIIKKRDVMKIQKKFINRFEMKILAILTMFIDHVGAVFFPNDMTWRLIGRFSFPIFALLLVEGFFHTHSKVKYIKRMLLLAFISEIFYDLVFYHRIFYLQDQNILFELSLGLILFTFLEKYQDKSWLLKIFLVTIACLISKLFCFNYGIYGIIFLYFCFLMHDKIYRLAGLIFLLNVIFIAIGDFFVLQLFSFLAIFLFLFYNGEQGKKGQYFFYVFYPVHLIILFIGQFIFR